MDLFREGPQDTLLRRVRGVEGWLRECRTGARPRCPHRAESAHSEPRDRPVPRIALIALSQLGTQPVQRIERAPGAPLLVLQREGEYFVLDDACSHGDASLAQGELAGDEILCPHHRGGFDIRSGVATRPPCVTAIGSYRVSVDDGMLYIDTDEARVASDSCGHALTR